MKTRLLPTDNFAARFPAVMFFLSVLLILLITLPVFGVTLLSDKVIADISAGAGETVKVWIEDNRHGAVSDSYYYGDTDGIPGAPNPGYLVYTIPTPDFQSAGIPGNPGFYTDFEYRFASRADANRFQNQLESNGRFTNIRQRPTYSNSSADNLLLDDGTAAKIVQVTVITENEVSPRLVRQFNGTVVEEPVVFNLHFPEIGKTETTFKKSADGTRQYDRNAWTGHEHQYGKTGWPNVNYQSAYVEVADHHYGKLVEYGNGYSDAPIRDNATGNILVPADTVFVKTTMAPLEMYSPEIALGFALASMPDNQSAAACSTTDGCGTSGTGSTPGDCAPDLSAGYCSIGILGIHNVTIKMSGTENNGYFGEIDDGNGIYLYGRNN